MIREKEAVNKASALPTQNVVSSSSQLVSQNLQMRWEESTSSTYPARSTPVENVTKRWLDCKIVIRIHKQLSPHSGRNINEKFVAWKDNWVHKSRCAPSLRIFALDALLPFWMSCNKCGKFRKASNDENEWTTDRIAEFTCADLYNTSNSCSTREDKVGSNDFS